MNIEPVIILTNICNHKCIFCSRKDKEPIQSDEEKKIIVKNYTDTISFEGGEPTLSRDLIKWVRIAKKNRIREIMLVTNGFSLDREDVVRALLDAGVNVFNINFPSHIERIYNLLTDSCDYTKTVNSIKNIIKIVGGNRLRITMVLNKLNYVSLKDYFKFIKTNFGDIFYTEINMIKVKGRVKNRLYLVPRLSEINKFLIAGLNEAKKLNLKVISDGIPLCFMPGFEELNIDVFNLLYLKNKWNKEKQKKSICDECMIEKICSGPRKDYVKLYGSYELKPVKDEYQLESIIERMNFKYEKRMDK